MIKIKEYIFNENDILYIKEQNNHIIVNTRLYEMSIDNATFDDIIWNYGNTNTKPYVVMAKSIAEDLANANKKIKELEKDDTFEHLYNTLNGRCKRLVDYVDDLKDSKLINVNIAKNIKGIIQNGF